MLIREARLNDCRAIGMVQLESWRSAYTPIMPAVYPDFLAQFTYDEEEADWREIFTAEPAPIVYVAETEPDKRVVGFAYGVPKGLESYDSELSVMHIIAEFRGQGIGRRLFGAVARSLKAKGCESLFVWTLKDNTGARRFYERLGGQLFSEKSSEIGKGEIGFWVTDVAYGWPKIDALCEL